MKKTLLLLALIAPSPLLGQSRTLVSPYLSSDGSVRGSPMMVGINVTHETGWLALRGGAALDARLTPVGSWMPATATARSYGADADGLVFAGDPAGAGPVPYALAGLGARLVQDGGALTTGATWSYGAGVRTAVTGWLGVEGEARRHEALTAARTASAVGAGWEFRVAASVRLTAAGMRPRAAVPAPVAGARAAAAPSAAARLRVAERALDTADDYVGVRYTWGGNTPEQGFDCSGFVRWVFQRQGIELPRVSRDQARAGAALPLDLAALEPGDLIAFASKGGVVDHIAIYAGSGRIIHSSASGRGVRWDDLNSQRGRWYREHMVAARRVIDAPWSFSAQQ